MTTNQSKFFSKFSCLLLVAWLWLFGLATPVIAAGIGDPAPSCSATGIQYSVTNVVPSGYCYWSGANITVTFDVNLWGSQLGHNLSVGYTAAGDSTLRDIDCLDSGIDLDSAGCDDYDSSGTAANPLVAQASLNVSCGLPANSNLAPIDLYLNHDANAGGVKTEVTATDCLLATGISIPYRAASLVMKATVINNDGGSANPGDWTLTANLGAGAKILTGTGYYAGGGQTFGGDYVLSGAGPAGYVLDSIACKNTTFDAATSIVALKPNERANCVFTYNDLDTAVVPVRDASLTMKAIVINDNAGTANPGNWILTATQTLGTDVVTGTGYYTANGQLFGGDYELTGAGPTGYVLDEITCTNSTFDAATSILALESGIDTSCVYTYNDIEVVTAPDTLLTLTKSVVNDDGGVAVVEDFELSIDGAEVVSGMANIVAPGTTLTISELGLPDYTAGVWKCIDNAGLTANLPYNGLATGTIVRLVEGSDVVCSIENNDDVIILNVDLAISKSVTDLSPSVGDVIKFDLQVTNAGPDDATDVVTTDVLAAGLAYVPGSITGGSTVSDSDPSGNGLQWIIASLPSGVTITLSYQATVVAP